MGRIYLEKNGKTTVLFNNEDINSISAQTDTYFVGTDLNTGQFEKKNPDGSIINLEAGNYATISRADFITLLNNSGLTEGVYYKITGVHTDLYGGTDIILAATSSNSVSSRGYGLFYNPKYDEYNVWSNVCRINIYGQTGEFNSIETFTSNNSITGQFVSLPGVYTMSFTTDGSFNDWDSASTITGDTSGTQATLDGIFDFPNYAVGDKVIWGGKVWVNLTGNIGASIDAFNLDSNWSVITYNTNDYNLVADVIDYNIEYDVIFYRENQLNKVTCYLDIISEIEYSTIKAFPWGNPFVNAVECNNGIINNLINFNGFLLSNVKIGFNSFFDFNYWGKNSYIIDIVLKGGYAIQGTQGITNIVLGDSNYFFGIELGVGTNLTQINIANNDNSNINFDSIKIGDRSGDGVSEIRNIVLLPNVKFGNIIMDNCGNSQNGVNSSHSSISNVILHYNSKMFNIKMGQNSIIDTIECIEGGKMRDIIMGQNTNLTRAFIDYYSDIFNINLVGGSKYGAWTKYSHIDNVNIGPYTYMHDIVIGEGSHIENIGMNGNSYGRIRYINIALNSNINNISIHDDYVNFENIEMATESNISGINLYYQSYFGNLKLNNSAEISSITLQEYSSFDTNELGINASINNCILNSNSSFETNKLGIESYIQMVTLNPNVSLYNITIGNILSIYNLTLNNSIESKIIEKNNNNFPATLDITGLSDIDLNSVYFAGEVTLTSSNSGETINTISNSRTFFPVKFLAYSAISVTFSGTPVTSLTSSNQIIMPSANFIISGNTHDYFIVKNNNYDFVQQIDAQNYI